MLTTLDPGPVPMSAAVRRAPSILDLLLQGDLLDGDIDAAVDAYLADPTAESYALHALYRIDFAEIAAAMRVSARCARDAGGRDGRQALMCALLLHRPRLLQLPVAAPPG
ncbi:hypothetical protein [Methylobacterium nonmethylotrophicum]|uniref:Uncharacterized protein n=1 Tax=Methylobacterium nonmethylotrophicum TaxID=1141884 RepID=A0A4Z0NN45_9HYPH|nr:hypothetical protein [Methylobacterium nonmethylotrophicum]TGD97328.1 hypothetical protein EU555_19335 [Methylobacterium nonmethylotrophicum]